MLKSAWRGLHTGRESSLLSVPLAGAGSKLLSPQPPCCSAGGGRGLGVGCACVLQELCLCADQVPVAVTQVPPLVRGAADTDTHLELEPAGVDPLSLFLEELAELFCCES